jgi:hypothetical protein
MMYFNIMNYQFHSYYFINCFSFRSEMYQGVACVEVLAIIVMHSF